MARVSSDAQSLGPLRRMRMVLLAKAAVATAFLGVVLFTVPHPVSLAVSAVDLALIPAFYVLARRSVTWATYVLVAETALGLTPRQFVQGYVNGVNWPIYIVLPLIAGYVLMSPRALRAGFVITLAIGLPVMLIAAATLPPGMRPADVLTLIVFVCGLSAAAAAVIADLIRTTP